MVLFTVAGDQVPEIPLSEVVGNVGAVVPEHIDVGMVEKVGTVVETQLLHVSDSGGTQGNPSAEFMVIVTL